MNKEIILNPSLLSANFYNIKEDLQILYKDGIKYLHMDVMDGMFVPNISFGIPFIKSVTEELKKDGLNFIIDTHLMINEPHRYVKDFKICGSDIITIHFEAESDIIKCIEDIKNTGAKVGISINPKTKIRQIERYIELVDQVLVMSVNPGFGGQKFIDMSLDKIKELKEIILEKNLNTDIEVDGGITKDNINDIIKSGANIIVMGSSIFKGGNITHNIEEIKQKIGEIKI